MNKNFDEWNNMKKELQNTEFADYVKERDVWWCSLGVNVGSEEDGKNDLYERPVLVIIKFNRDSVLIVPFTTNKKIGKYYFSLEHNYIEYTLVLSQIRFVSTKRLLRKIFSLQENTFREVQELICSMIKN